MSPVRRPGSRRACCAAARGTIILGTRARPPATTITLIIATTTGGFGWRVWSTFLGPFSGRVPSDTTGGARKGGRFQKCRAITVSRLR